MYINELQNILCRLQKVDNPIELNCTILHQVLNRGKLSPMNYPQTYSGVCALRDGETAMDVNGVCIRCKRYMQTEHRYYCRQYAEKKPIPDFNFTPVRQVLFEKYSNDIVSKTKREIAECLVNIVQTIGEDVILYHHAQNEKLIFMFDRIHGRFFKHKDLSKIILTEYSEQEQEILFERSLQKIPYVQKYREKKIKQIEQEPNVRIRETISTELTCYKLLSTILKESLKSFMEMADFRTEEMMPPMQWLDKSETDNKGVNFSLKDWHLLGVTKGYELQASSSNYNTRD